MKRIFFTFALLGSIYPTVHAGQFDSVIDALAIPLSANHTSSDWESMARIKNVRWSWPYNESGKHDYTMTGVLRRDIKISVEGTRSFVTSVNITIPYNSVEGDDDIEKFGEGKIEKIATTCDDDSVSESVAFYQFTKPGHKPLYVRRYASFGASGVGETQYNIAYALQDSLETLWNNPCEIEVNRQDESKSAQVGQNQTEPGDLLSKQQVIQIAGDMFRAYSQGNVKQMLAEEMNCWKRASREKGDKKKSAVATCMVAVMAGAFIEATYARSQLRGSHPQYTGEVARARILENHGLPEVEGKRIFESTIEPNVPVVIEGLMGAGMR